MASKNIVAADLADRCEIQISYAIGMVEPVSIMVDTFETGKIADEKLTMMVQKHFDMTPGGIIKRLDLRRPIYAKTASYGHFGREPDADGGFSWEKTDLMDALTRGCVQWLPASWPRSFCWPHWPPRASDRRRP